MSYTLKGFGVNSTYVDNTLGAVSAIGELSDISLTYSKEKGYYKNDSISNDIVLVSFTSADTGVSQPVDGNVRDRVLAIIKLVYDQIALKQQLFADTLAQTLLTAFQSTAQNFVIGGIIQTPDQQFWTPTWVSWSDNALAGSAIKIWFNDPAFQTQFDDFSITVVPPITPLDDFFKIGSQVDAEVNAVTFPQAMTAIQAARATNPETILLAQTYNYIDPANASHLVPTNWTVLLYGPNGNSVDAIKNALITYILANSTHSRADWTAILPDLFKVTEFVLVPRYDILALPNQVGQVGIYATQMNLAQANAVFKKQIPAYAAAQVDQYLNTMGHPYKSLQILSVGGTDNRTSLFELSDVFPDIINVSTTSPDFGRMSAPTRAFLIALDTMVQTAETMDAFSSVPTGFSRLVRDGNVYIVLNSNNIDYLVLSKASLLANNAA